jgi:hypothetical protein
MKRNESRYTVPQLGKEVYFCTRRSRAYPFMFKEFKLLYKEVHMSDIQQYGKEYN